MRNEFWPASLWPLVSHTLGQSTVGTAVEDQPIILGQLVDLWREFFMKFSSKSPELVSIAEREQFRPGQHVSNTLDPSQLPAVPRHSNQWSCLPHLSQLDRVTTGSHLSPKFEERLDKFVTKYDMTPAIGLPILITFLFFTRREYAAGIPQSLRTEAFPFVRFVAHIIPGANMARFSQEIRNMKDADILSQESTDFLQEAVESIPTRALKVIGAKRFASAMPTTQDPRVAEELMDFLIKRLARAFERQDMRIIINLWEEARSVFAVPNSKRGFLIPSKIYDALLSGLMEIKRADLAMAAWNEMISNGTKPTVITWTAMLAGCQKGRDLNGLEQIWARMIASGVQPDNAAWNARLFGLISMGARDEGLTALSEMGKAWKDAQNVGKPTKTKSKIKGAEKRANPPKPDTASINAVLTALAHLPVPPKRKRDAMETVLRWASSFEIKADNITYNVLLRQALQEGNASMVSKIIASMKADQIAPDIATYTILINDTLKTTRGDLSEDEQRQSMIDFLENIEANGLTPNTVLYSTIIDQLLKRHSNVIASRAVLDHMAQRSIIPSAQIYTSLITHYFDQDPPAIEAVDSLWNTIINTPGSITDRTLYDRMIEGYARCDEIGKMITVLTRMSREGKNPSWSALMSIVTALTRAGDWERARQIVSDVKNGVGFAKDGVSRRGQTHGRAEVNFWELVNNLGLGDDLEISSSTGY
ncbi:uncharacterized protein BDZ99DRAFT_406663 [Mytilinidion resinicola]|uniref:Pentatricopeptide repeat-containing protein n=1 Tax=Mytilinidion resinicola TaxID=574789 RepID=A0A6A6Z7B6_9PEZI|nr:uncharacterized protein BDZ99DRAFT_406663 [Mytilinidion resinicola]KAF2816145.1 hypothetical protein BDZ99DRAFT_406663 [Mytilinidion resinicola]